MVCGAFRIEAATGFEPPRKALDEAKGGAERELGVDRRERPRVDAGLDAGPVEVLELVASFPEVDEVGVAGLRKQHQAGQVLVSAGEVCAVGLEKQPQPDLGVDVLVQALESAERRVEGAVEQLVEHVLLALEVVT